jgi:NAD(P)-dependent dehydrogenase (short-subunit alcohol dehydrogenase family)
MKLRGKTVLITGSTDGVGRHVALALGAAGATTLIHGRDRQRGEAVIDELRKRGNTGAQLYLADLGSLAEVRRLAEAIRRDHPRLDVLINNAGIGSASGGRQRRTSTDGYELRFAVFPDSCSPACCCPSSSRARRAGSSTSPPPASRRSTSTT